MWTFVLTHGVTLSEHVVRIPQDLAMFGDDCLGPGGMLGVGRLMNQIPARKAQRGGSTEALGTGGSANESDAAKPGVGGGPTGGGPSVTMGGGGGAGRPLTDAAVPVFTTGPDDPISPDPGVTMPFVHSLFTDHMVLQRDAMTPVWGWSQPGDKIPCRLRRKVHGDRRSIRTLVGSHRTVRCGRPWTLAISGPKSVTLQDVFFGDVWLCSGQSNMVLPVNQILNGTAEVGSSGLPSCATSPFRSEQAKRLANAVQHRQLGGGQSQHHHQPLGHLLLLRTLPSAEAQGSDRDHRCGGRWYLDRSVDLRARLGTNRDFKAAVRALSDRRRHRFEQHRQRALQRHDCPTLPLSPSRAPLGTRARATPTTTPTTPPPTSTAGCCLR